VFSQTEKRKDDYVEVTLWSNGGGFDIDIDATTRERMSMTWGQFAAIKKLVKRINK